MTHKTRGQEGTVWRDRIKQSYRPYWLCLFSHLSHCPGVAVLYHILHDERVYVHTQGLQQLIAVALIVRVSNTSNHGLHVNVSTNGLIGYIHSFNIEHRNTH